MKDREVTSWYSFPYAKALSVLPNSGGQLWAQTSIYLHFAGEEGLELFRDPELKVD